MMTIDTQSMNPSGYAQLRSNPRPGLGSFGSFVVKGFYLNLLLIFAIFGFSSASLAEETVPVSQATEAPDYTRQVAEYAAPDLEVVRQDGKKLSFTQALNDGRPVIMSFIFASCSAICPMLSHTLMKIQSKLENSPNKAHLMSITIDPENDTPAILTEYAKKFSAGPDWDFYTGSREISINLQKAFNVYRGDKMNHTSVILIRVRPGAPWVRLEGFLNADMVVSEYQK
jgi:protein SCO1/2